MCISLQTMGEVESALVDFTKLTNNPLPMLKSTFPHLSFVRMSANDIDEPPFRAMDQYNLYLLDAREHCVQLTSDLTNATGLVIAQR